jgi:hypothetical protein
MPAFMRDPVINTPTALPSIGAVAAGSGAKKIVQVGRVRLADSSVHVWDLSTGIGLRCPKRRGRCVLILNMFTRLQQGDRTSHNGGLGRYEYRRSIQTCMQPIYIVQHSPSIITYLS